MPRSTRTAEKAGEPTENLKNSSAGKSTPKRVVKRKSSDGQSNDKAKRHSNVDQEKLDLNNSIEGTGQSKEDKVLDTNRQKLDETEKSRSSSGVQKKSQAESSRSRSRSKSHSLPTGEDEQLDESGSGSETESRSRRRTKFVRERGKTRSRSISARRAYRRGRST